MGSLSEEVEALAPLYRGGIAGFAALDDADCRERAVVRLVELPRLRVSKRDPITNTRTIRKRSAGDSLPPLIWQQ